MKKSKIVTLGLVAVMFAGTSCVRQHRHYNHNRMFVRTGDMNSYYYDDNRDRRYGGYGYGYYHFANYGYYNGTGYVHSGYGVGSYRNGSPSGSYRGSAPASYARAGVTNMSGSSVSRRGFGNSGHGSAS